MADVTMDLAELDQLRDDLKTKTETINVLEKALIEMEADKRTVEITRKVTVPSRGYLYLKYQTGRAIINDIIHLSKQSSNHFHSQHLDDSVAKIIKKNIRVVESHNAGWMMSMGAHEAPLGEFCTTGNNTPEISKAYLHFDDVQQELRIKAEADVADELGVLKAKNSELRKKVAEDDQRHADEIARLTTDHEKHLNKLGEVQDAYVAELKEVHDKEVEDLSKEVLKWVNRYNDLKEDRDTRTKEQKYEDTIAELQKQLEEAQTPWYKKLF